MNIGSVKKWDKNSLKYRVARWVSDYLINPEHFGEKRTIRRILGGQHFDMEIAESVISPKEGIIIDVGAERGDVAGYFFHRGFTVYAIEPESKNIKYLWVHNFFKVLRGRFKIFHLACGETSGIAKLHISNLSYRHSLGEDDKNQLNGEVQNVKVARLGDFITKNNLKKIALLKIDAEGWDLPILKGLFNSTKIEAKVVMFEADQNYVQPLVDLMRQHGYKHFRFICRWSGEGGLSSQQVMGLYDGLHPDVFTTGSNVICTKENYFRPAYPLIAD